MNFFDISFWQDFVSNSLATFLGAIIGIPIALGLSRHQEKASENERKQRLLPLLREELLVNLTQLSGWNKAKDKKAEAITIGPFLRDETWQAFSDGGELESIKNPRLISELANAYSYIRLMQQLSERYLSLLYMTPDEKTHPIAIDFIWAMVEKGISESTEMVMLALKAINTEEK
jgi:hypothetical protein